MSLALAGWGSEMNRDVHDFQERLAFSHAAEDWPVWEEIYRKAFPSFSAMIDHRQDGEHQRAGIDRSVILSNSKQILVDEKARDPKSLTPEDWKRYQDILLEYLSNDVTGAPGWVCKPLRADYIAYAVMCAGLCFLLPVPQLQLAWSNNSTEWIAQFGKKPARNPGYRTWSCPVPVNTLFPAIGKCLRVSFRPVAC